MDCKLSRALSTLKKMYLTFNEKEIKEFRDLGKHIRGSKFREKKTIFYDLVSFFKTSKLENCYDNIKNAEKIKLKGEQEIRIPIGENLNISKIIQEEYTKFTENINNNGNRKFNLEDDITDVSGDEKLIISDFMQMSE